MANSWKELTIEQLQAPRKGAIAMGPFGSRIKAENFVDTGVPVIKGAQLHETFLNDVSFDYLTQEKADELSSSKAHRGDIVITHRGTIGQVSVIPYSSKFGTYIVSQSQLKVSLNTDMVNPYFVAYFLNSRLGQHRLLLNSSQVGVPAIAQASTSVKQILVPVPELEEQNQIVEYLLNLDDRIELNRQINQTLEQLAQALFKSWFVDFDPVFDNALASGVAINDFPEALQKKARLRYEQRFEQRQQVEFTESDVKPLPADILKLFPSEFEQTDEPSTGINGWIPNGWQANSIHDMVDTISDTYKLKEVDEVIFLNTGDIENGKFLHNDFSSTDGLPGQAKKSIAQGDILYSEIRPKNKRFAFVNFDAKEYVVSTKLMVLRAKEGISPLLPYFILTQEKIINELQHIAEHRSGTFPQITFKELEKVKTAFPQNSGLVDYFVQQHLTPIMDKKFSSIEQSEKLEKLRDTLLPKLISGEINVNSIQ